MDLDDGAAVARQVKNHQGREAVFNASWTGNPRGSCHGGPHSCRILIDQIICPEA
jgi:hypothetical protein